MNIEKAKRFEDDEQLMSLKRELRNAIHLAIQKDNQLDWLITQRKLAWYDVDALHTKLKEYQVGRA